MATRPRDLFQFSLRTLLVLLTIGCAWLGWKVERTHAQREAIDAIQELGGTVCFDWEGDPLDWASEVGEPAGPIWLRRICGDDFFQEATGVAFNRKIVIPDSDILGSIPELKRLRKLRVLIVYPTVSPRTLDALKAALPGCQVYDRGRPLWLANKEADK